MFEFILSNWLYAGIVYGLSSAYIIWCLRSPGWTPSRIDRPYLLAGRIWLAALCWLAVADLSAGYQNQLAVFSAISAVMIFGYLTVAYVARRA